MTVLYILTTVVVFVSILHSGLPFPTFLKQIPNGDKVPHPCDKTTFWPGVGHERFQGQGPLNPFGQDFLANNKHWTDDLCKKDSDGDGKTNGEELGDPSCQWQAGQLSPNATTISHPGVCEPITSYNCLAKNLFLSKIEICADVMNATSEPWCPGVSDNNSTVQQLQITFNQTVLPSNDTTYLCQMFTLPSDKDYHIVAWEPIIDNQELMHHLVLYTCNTPLDETQLLKSKQFQTPEVCGMSPMFCQSLAVVWAFGQENRCYNNQSGVLMGNSSFRYAIMQIHYNNPSLKANVVDSSGLRLYYTPKLRPEHTSMINFGQIDFVIPPNSPGTKAGATMFTTPACSLGFLGNGKYHLSSLLFHMHKLGSHAKLILTRASGKKITIIDEEVTYDRPKFLVWSSADEAPILEPGDNLDMECTFKSQGKSNYTFLGEKTSDEMCTVFMEVFPRPMNLAFFSFDNIGDANSCSWMQAMLDPIHAPPVVINNCPVATFGTFLKSLANSTSGGIGVNCPPSLDYPAKTCSPNCATFLEANNLTSPNPCMEAAMFRLLTMYSAYFTWEDAYRAQSHVDVCLGRNQSDTSVPARKLIGKVDTDNMKLRAHAESFGGGVSLTRILAVFAFETLLIILRF